MLYYSSELKWEDAHKNNLINLYYNMTNLRRFIKVGIHDMVIEPKKKSLFNKNNDDNIREFPLENTDIDIFASKYRQFLDKYDPKNVTELPDLLTNIDEFTDFILFLDKAHEKRNTLAVEAHSDGDIRDLDLYGMRIKMEQSVIPKPSKSGSIILDMIDGSSDEDKYITMYTIDWHHTYKLISGESNPRLMGLDDRIIFTKATDQILDRMYTYAKEFYTDMIDFNTNLDYKVISDNFARGKVYVTK